MSTAYFKRTLIVVSTLSLLAYLLLSRNLWFAERERAIEIGSDRRIRPIDIGHVQTITWKISGDDWKYHGECQLALVLDKLPSIPAKHYNKKSMTLSVRVGAYAITYQPVRDGRVDGLRADRLIRNWYYTTDTPLAREARIWEFMGTSNVEFGLCGVQRYSWEDTYITMEILQPDPVLAGANPRLQLVGEYDEAVYEDIWLLRGIRDVVLLTLGVCLIVLTYNAWTAR